MGKTRSMIVHMTSTPTKPTPATPGPSGATYVPDDDRIAEIAREWLLQACGCPPKCGGSLLYLKAVESMLATNDEPWLESREKWQDLTKQTASNLRTAGIVNGDIATDEDRKHVLWAELLDCIHQRAKPGWDAAARKVVDATFLRCLLTCVMEKRLINPELLSGFRQLYKVKTYTKTKAQYWHPLLEGMSKNVDLREWLEEKPRTPVVENFCRKLIPLSTHHIAPPQDRANACASQEQRADVKDTTVDATHPGAKSTDESRNGTSQDSFRLDETSEKQERSPFRQGDAILPKLAQLSWFDGKESRRAQENWDCVTTQQATQLAASLATSLREAGSEDEMGPILLAMTLFSTSMPLNVLLNVPTTRSRDLYFDPRGGYVAFSREYYLAILSPSTFADEFRAREWLETDTEIRIPLSICVHQGWSRLANSRPDAKYVIDLLCPPAQTGDAKVLHRRVGELLKQLSVDELVIFPGKLARSMGPLATEILGDTQFVSLITRNPGLTSTGAQHYVHFPDRFVHKLCDRLYAKIGWGGAQPLPLRLADAFDQLPSVDQVRYGLQAIENKAHQCAVVIKSSTVEDELIAAFNQLCELSAFLVNFCLAGRGSKIERLRNGDVMVSGEYVHLADKHVDGGGGSRLIGKIPFLVHVIMRHLGAQLLVCKKLAGLFTKNSGDSFKELAKGELRFDATFFQKIQKRQSSLERTYLYADAIERVSQAFLGASKNIGRHLVVTHWSLQGHDDLVLRAITGHGSIGNEIPARCGMYSPLTLLQKTGENLRNLHAQWLPKEIPCPFPTVQFQLQRLPLGLIAKNYRGHRTWIERPTVAPAFNQLHLASKLAIEEVRQRLLNGIVPSNSASGLLLHLMVFDGFHEPNDHAHIFQVGPEGAGLEKNNTALAFKRAGSIHRIRVALTTVTASYLKRFRFEAIPALEDITKLQMDIAVWLNAEVACFAAQPKRAQSSTAQEYLQLTACASLTFDLEVPSALQIAYEPLNQTATLDDFSSGCLYGVEGQPYGEPYKAFFRSGSGREDLRIICAAVNHCADSSKKLGEEKARASLLRLMLKESGFQGSDTVAGMLIDAILKNLEHIHDGRSSKIQISSTATYLSALLPTLEAWSDFHPHSSSNEEWTEFLKELVSGVHAEARAQSDVLVSMRAERYRSAGLWLTSRLKECGYEVPLNRLAGWLGETQNFKSTTCIALIESHQLENARVQVVNSHPMDRLRQKQANAMFHVLEDGPFRWMEAAAVGGSDLLLEDSKIVIRTHGFSHLKSDASFRLVPMTKQTLEALQDLLATNRELHLQAEVGDLLFASKKDGVVSLAGIDWLHDEITRAMFRVTGNPRTRIHSARAMAACELAFQDWIESIRQIASGSMDAADLRERFAYDHSTAWQLHRAATICGHSAPEVTIDHYFGSALQVRSMYLESQVTQQKVPNWAFKSINRTRWAWRSQTRRDSTLPRTPWPFIRRELCALHLGSLGKRTAPTTATSVVTGPPPLAGKDERLYPEPTPTVLTKLNGLTSSIPVSQAVRYVALRLMEEELPTCMAYTGLPHAACLQLEELLGGEKTTPLKCSDVAFFPLTSLTAVTRSQLRKKLKIGSSDEIAHLICKPDGLALCRDLLDLLERRQVGSDWEAKLFASGRALVAAGLGLRVVRDGREQDAFMNMRLHGKPGVFNGNYADDVGPIPRFFVVMQSQPENKRSMGVLSPLTSLLCLARVWLSTKGVGLSLDLDPGVLSS